MHSMPSDRTTQRLRLACLAMPLVATFGFTGLATERAAAADALTFAFVAPVANSPFFDEIAAGCAGEAKRLTDQGRAMQCLYAGPGLAKTTASAATSAPPTRQPAAVSQPATPPAATPASTAADATPPAIPAPAPAAPAVDATDKRTEAQIIADFTTAHVDGLAVSPTTDAAVAEAIRGAVRAGIPVVTVDTDVIGTGRAAAIGTNARDFGRALGASLKRWKPNGGKYVIISTDPKQANMAERIYGVRDALGPGWSELAESPVVTTGDYADAVGKIDHLLNAYYDIDAIISVGAWPMLEADAWRDIVARYKARVDKADVVLVVADALPGQKDLVRQGLGHVLVGQKPGDMGARAIDLLLRLSEKRKVPEVVYVGFETFTRLDLVKPSN